jgi:membrane protease subunit HflK
MAWNQPGKGSDAWRGKGPGGGKDAWMQRLRDLFGGPAGGFGPAGIAAAAIGLLLLLNSFKLIDAQEKGVVLRFGAYHRTMGEGANFKWPWPVESVTVVNVTNIQNLEDEVRVLTRDGNIINVKFNVQYDIGDPRDFLFAFRDDLLVNGVPAQGRETLQNAAESAVREVIGNHTMDTALFNRGQLVGAAQEHLQASLDLYRTGLNVTDLNLTDARPPAEVKEAFDEANRAAQDKESSINTANAYASTVVPEARGEALRIKAQGKGYRDAIIANAEGDAARFTQLVAQYRKAPEVTRKRLYLETMQHVLEKNRKVLSGRDNNVLYLPMDGASPAGPAALPTMPAVKATTPVPQVEAPLREPRAAGREGTR